MAYYFYAQWFISVWCFFAALLSLAVYGHFAARQAWAKAPLDAPGTKPSKGRRLVFWLADAGCRAP